MNIDQIEAFLTLYEQQSFSRAASQLYVSQPQLSRQIQRLENELSLKLFERTSHYVCATAAGAALYRELQGVPERIRFAVEEARQATDATTGQITIGVLEGLSTDYPALAPLYAWMRTHRSVEVVFVRDSSAHLKTGLNSGKYHLILAFQLWDESHSDLDHLVIFEEETVALISRNNWPGAEITSAAELSGQDFVLQNEESAPLGRRMFLQICRDNLIRPDRVLSVTGYDTQLTIIKQGLACGIMNRTPELERDENIRILPLRVSRPTNLVLAWKRDVSNAAAQSLVQAIRQAGRQPRNAGE